MHELFAQVLSQKDLSKAGDLFSIDDREIENDLSTVLHKIRDISGNSGYVHSVNDQSVVEICVTRVTSAIRETDSIEKHVTALVDLLESCLRYNLCPHVKDEDPPHAKIACDVLSCIFLNYSKKSVIEMALPTAVRFLTKGNKEVCHSLSSYLSLAAMSHSKLLAAHLPLMLDSIIVYRNHKLSRVLPHLYHENRDVVLSHIADIIHLLPECETPERCSVLQLCCLVAKDQPQVLEPCIPQLCLHMTSTSTAVMVLQSFADMAAWNAEAFVGHVGKLKQTAVSQPNTQNLIAMILGAVGRVNKIQSKDSVSFFVSQLSLVDSHCQLTLLREIRDVCECFPNILPEFIDDIDASCQTSSSSARLLVQQLSELASRRGNAPDRRTIASQTDGVVTVITIGNAQSLHQTKSDHVAILSNAVLGGIKNQKNASTSTQDIDFGGGARCSSDASPRLPVSATRLEQTYQKHRLPQMSRLSSQHDYTAASTQRGTSPQLSSSATSSAGGTVLTTPTIGRISERPYRQNALNPDSRSNAVGTLPNRTSLPGVRVTQTRHIPVAGSVFVPQQSIPMRDAVQQFCEKHLDNIKLYVHSVTVKMPIPINASLQESSNRKWFCLVDFACASQTDNCLYGQSSFSLRTKYAKIWIHLMFLAMQERSSRPLTLQDPTLNSLKSTWDAIKTDSSCSFIRLVTSSFPSAKDQSIVLQELTMMQYFDLFEFHSAENQWSCFLCSHPEKVMELLQEDGLPVFAGPLKEKKGRLKVLKPWKSRYYTLSGATITYEKKDSQQAISNIQTVKVVRKGSRGIPTAFEIFANDKSYVFKAKDSENAEQWIQCLQIIVARTQRQNRDSVSDVNVVPRWASLGRPVQHSVISERYRHNAQSRI